MENVTGFAEELKTLMEKYGITCIKFDDEGKLVVMYNKFQ